MQDTETEACLEHSKIPSKLLRTKLPKVYRRQLRRPILCALLNSSVHVARNESTESVVH